MRNAHYVWLKGNPSFLFIPPDYVIHHLDGDPLNNDITNLVIMQKHYHISYHAKKFGLSSPVKLINLQDLGVPNKKQKVYKNHGGNSWYLQ